MLAAKGTRGPTCSARSAMARTLAGNPARTTQETSVDGNDQRGRTCNSYCSNVEMLAESRTRGFGSTTHLPLSSCKARKRDDRMSWPITGGRNQSSLPFEVVQAPQRPQISCPCRALNRLSIRPLVWLACAVASHRLDILVLIIIKTMAL